MYNVNMWGQWGITPPTPEVEKHKDPDSCDFCAIGIDDGDYYWGGYDVNYIYAECCDGHRCKQWLEHRVRVRKGYQTK